MLNSAPIRSVSSFLTEVLFPPVCPVCRVEVGASASLCPACWQKVSFIGEPDCDTCGRPIPGAQIGEPDLICDACVESPRNWTRGAATIKYQDVGRNLVLSLKHGDRLDIVPMLAGWMLRAGSDLVKDADVIAPVPLHWSRLLKRRYNQSAELARHISMKAGMAGKYAPRLISRRRRTPSQDGKDRSARVANLEDALAPGAQANRLKDSRVLIIDDVLTTGASLAACADLCLAHGAKAVDILVLALVIREETAYSAGEFEEREYEIS